VFTARYALSPYIKQISFVFKGFKELKYLCCLNWCTSCCHSYVLIWVSGSNSILGRAMAQAVSRPPSTAEDRVRSQVSPRGICGGQSGTGTGFSPSSSVFPCQFHSTSAPLLGKGQKIIIIFIIGLHNKPHGCSASVASAAGPFTTQKKKSILYVTSWKEFIYRITNLDQTWRPMSSVLVKWV
jgi:hypothetical protein